MIKDLAQVNAELQEQKERVDTVDFKMVTFSLADKEYGVDIMNVKEIAKADKFTYVPNAASFVRGVYNLRGDIIPIIDLRMFFHLPVEKKDAQENMLILRIADKVYGTIVDKIDKVVGINSEQVQPPHPIFGDINIKYISGVVEKLGELYIILDVIRIFTQSDDEKQKPRGSVETTGGGTYFVSPSGVERATTLEEKVAISDSSFNFIRESLPALKHFYPSEINDKWMRERFADWNTSRTGEDLQLKSIQEAEEYLSGFYSPYTGDFWSDDYAEKVKELLPSLSSNNIQVWNIGCGKGYETFSFACILKSRYPEGRIKIWANDNDIMTVSQAPNITFDLEEIPEYCRPFTTSGRNGYSFSQAIKDSVVFEYHDVLSDNPLPDLDIILARDVLSFLQPSDQQRLIEGFVERLKHKGLVILGRNEFVSGLSWEFVGKEPVSVFTHTQ